MRKPLTVPEAMEYANVGSNKTIYSWFKKGLPSWYENGRRIDPDDLDEYIQKRKEQRWTGIR